MKANSYDESGQGERETVVIVDDSTLSKVKSMHGMKTMGRLNAEEALPRIFDSKETMRDYLEHTAETASTAGSGIDEEELPIMLDMLDESEDIDRFFKRISNEGPREYNGDEPIHDSLMDKFWSYAQGDTPKSYKEDNPPIKEKIRREQAEMLAEKTFEIAEEGGEKEFLDLTQMYRDGGGQENRDIYLVAEPKVPELGSFSLYEKNRAEEMAEVAMDYSRAVEIIESLDPDVLLVDMKFKANIPDRIREKLTSEELEVDFTLDAENASGETHFTDSLPDRELTYEGSGVMEHGGVMLGEYLSEEDIDYSFWTSEYPHGQEAFRTAYALGLASEQDCQSLVNDINEAWENENYRRVTRSDNGNLIVQDKDLFDFDNDRGPYTPMKPDATDKLDNVIEIAKQYQR